MPDFVEEIEYEFDNLNNFEKRIQKFEQDLQIFKLMIRFLMQFFIQFIILF